MGNLWNQFGPGAATGQNRSQAGTPQHYNYVPPTIGPLAAPLQAVKNVNLLSTALGADFGNVITAQLKGIGDQIKGQFQTIGPQVLIGALLVVVMIFAAYMFLKE